MAFVPSRAGSASGAKCRSGHFHPPRAQILISSFGCAAPLHTPARLEGRVTQSRGGGRRKQAQFHILGCFCMRVVCRSDSAGVGRKSKSHSGFLFGDWVS